MCVLPGVPMLLLQVAVAAGFVAVAVAVAALLPLCPRSNTTAPWRENSGRALSELAEKLLAHLAACCRRAARRCCLPALGKKIQKYLSNYK